MQPEQRGVTSQAASIYHSKQKRSHISDAANQLRSPVGASGLYRSLWVIHDKLKKSLNPGSHSCLCEASHAVTMATGVAEGSSNE